MSGARQDVKTFWREKRGWLDLMQGSANHGWGVWPHELRWVLVFVFCFYHIFKGLAKNYQTGNRDHVAYKTEDTLQSGPLLKTFAEPWFYLKTQGLPQALGEENPGS